MEGFEDFDLLLPNKLFEEECDITEIPYYDGNDELGRNGKTKSFDSVNLPSMTGAGFSSSFSESAFSRLPMPTVLNLDSSTKLRKSSGMSIDTSLDETKVEVKPEPTEEISTKSTSKRKKLDYAGMNADEIAQAKRKRRREQIAKASRLSRARRKQELLDLREENKKLKLERQNHIKTIKELSRNVEKLRESGDIDVIKENQMLRAQLEQHKTFLTCFKHLCDDNKQFPLSSQTPNESLFTKGANAAHEHVITLLSQSVADSWKEVIVTDDIDLPYEDFSASYKLVTEFGYSVNADETANRALKQRLNVRLDIGYEGMEAEGMVEFLWSALSSSSAQKRLYNVKNIEVVQLENNSISTEKNTKLYYYREKNEAPLKDNDWVVICNNRTRVLPSNLLEKPSKRRRKKAIHQVESTVLSLSTTQHGSAPEVPNTNRIKSFFLQGAIVYNDKADTRISVVFSFPDDFKTKMISGFDDIILPGGKIGPKFAAVIRELYVMLNEQDP